MRPLGAGRPCVRAPGIFISKEHQLYGSEDACSSHSTHSGTVFADFLSLDDFQKGCIPGKEGSADLE